MSDFKVSVRVDERYGLARAREPVRFGLPLPRGALAAAGRISITDGSGAEVPHQARTLAQWPDRTIKWLLVDAEVSAGAGDSVQLIVQPAADYAAHDADALTFVEDAGRLSIDTGVARFELGGTGVPLLGAEVGAVAMLAETGARLVLESRATGPLRAVLERPVLEESGPLRATVAASGRFVSARGATVLELETRATFFADSACVQLEVLVRNPRRARHIGGLWDLGDSGSFTFEKFALALRPGFEATNLQWYAEDPGNAQWRDAGAFTLYQDSSGGEHWKSGNHVGPNGASTVAFSGYRVFGADRSTPVSAGTRAQPCLRASSAQAWVAATCTQFWQNFPKALQWSGGQLEVALFPSQSGASFELQGGEQKRHTILLDFGVGDSVSDIPVLQSPLVACVDAEWIESTGAVPYFTPRATDPNRAYLDYIQGIIDGPRSFFAKREMIDEYGWRNFGDLYADHEAVKHKGSQPFVSHYNNQYDFIYGAFVHFLRTGEPRWRQLLLDAARHTIDIDVYHTTEDKPAFNGGLFWHTDHYKPAATCTHRTYSAHNGSGSGYGGGPSNEHNYTSGLLHYYFLTGDPEARRTVLGLADWVIAMDEGSSNVFALVSQDATGLASKTVSPSYHKAGRGAGNSINAQLDAYSLTRDRRYMRKAEDLIQRCIHPADDIAALNLGEPEYRWSYLVFLQVLGKFLDTKRELGEIDYYFHYARDSLLHYAAWMAEHEQPYKDVLHKVEIPTETWPAHDVRKCHVLHLAAKYAVGEGERELFRRRASFFFQRCIADLLSFETSYLTRPLVILSVYGHVEAYFQRHGEPAAGIGPHNYDFGAPVTFVPQRERLKSGLREKTRLVSAEISRVWRDKTDALMKRRSS